MLGSMSGVGRVPAYFGLYIGVEFGVGHECWMVLVCSAIFGSRSWRRRCSPSIWSSGWSHGEAESV